jgi:hypothetical protein
MSLKKILQSLFKKKDESINLDFTDVKINAQTALRDLPEFREKKLPTIPGAPEKREKKSPPTAEIPPFVPPSDYAKRAGPATPALPTDETDPSFSKTMKKMQIVEKDFSNKGYNFDDTDLKVGEPETQYQNPPKFPHFNPDEVPKFDSTTVTGTNMGPIEKTSMVDKLKKTIFPEPDKRPKDEDRTFAGGDGTVILRGALKPEGKKFLSRPMIYFLLLIGLGIMLKSMETAEKEKVVNEGAPKENSKQIATPVPAQPVEKAVRTVPERKKEPVRQVDPSRINFAAVGSGLVYNCQGKHWSCIDKVNYDKCEEAGKKNGSCHLLRYFSSNRECSTAQQDKVNSGFLVDFCP